MLILYYFFNILLIYRHPTDVPTACAIFEHELLVLPSCILEKAFTNLVSANRFTVGGHFAAMEQPVLLSDDVWNFVKILRRKQ